MHRQSAHVAGDALLEVDSIEVAYREASLVLRGLTLGMPPGGIVALLGPNGAGKSTTLKAISGLLRNEGGVIARGDVRWCGESIVTMSADAIVRRGIVQVMEGRGIVGNMTCRENLLLGAFTRKDRGIQRDIDMVYGYFPRLQERSGPAGYLSGGEQQMLAIGRALMARPRLLLLDEPSMGLSPRLVSEVFSIIRRLNTELGMAILLAEQNARMSLSVADSGYVIQQGEVLLTGSARELVANGELGCVYLSPTELMVDKGAQPL
jgi:branched-chain amino acid transport system ATP-binding protein